MTEKRKQHYHFYSKRPRDNSCIAKCYSFSTTIDENSIDWIYIAVSAIGEISIGGRSVDSSRIGVSAIYGSAIGVGAICGSAFGVSIIGWNNR